jgi:uncharacterized protein YjbI with pentapeptide repeats
MTILRLSAPPCPSPYLDREGQLKTCGMPALPDDSLCLAHSRQPKDQKALQRCVEQKLCQSDQYFIGWVFPGDISLRDVQFHGDVYFESAEFQGKADFTGAIFHAGTTFDQANFTGVVSFTNARFHGVASMRFAKFNSDAHFTWTRFIRGIDFFHADFQGRTLFSYTSFEGTSGFEGANLEKCEFLNIHDLGPRPHEFWPEDHPKRLTMSHVRFFRSRGMSSASFQDVNWQAVIPDNDTRSRSWRVVTRDELDARGLPRKEGELSSDPRRMPPANLEGAASVYRDLRRSYRDRRNFQMSNDMYFREMEMRRLSLASSKATWWGMLRRNLLSTTAIYWLIAGYGNSFFRALTWYLAVILVSMFLFAASGLQVRDSRPSLPESTMIVRLAPLSEFGSGTTWQSVVEGSSIAAMHAIRSSLLQKEADVVPVRWFGRIVEMLLFVAGPVLLFCMGLALRRAFER